MNKYLLLRDNKQSGPYTVPEIISMGIKPYDLVWLEGKSAAWRYPSEVEELKAYAPTVEEQPFDRFYKKPQEKTHNTPLAGNEPDTAAIASDHNRYKPQSIPDSGEPIGTKKVYINFPGANKPAIQPARKTFVPAAAAPIQEVITPIENKPSLPSEDLIRNVNAAPTSYQQIAENRQPADRRYANVAIAACLLLAIISGVLYFNYSRQRASLEELSTIVQELEDKEKASQTAPASLVNTDVPAEQAAENNTASLIPDINYDEQEKIPSETSPPKKQQPASTNKPAATDQAAVVFTEKKDQPISEETTEMSDPPVVSRENLFKLVEVKPNAYKTGVLGGISNLQFALTNNSDVELHRVAIEIKYLGPEKKVVRTQTVYFENVPPGAQSTIDVPKSNRGVTIEYHVTDIKS
jgi:negative regulator of sigma E activity